MTVDLTLFRTFVEVVRHGSFTGAANALGIAQPTASLRLLRLERMMGVTLIERTTRSAVPTEAGELLFLAASRLLDAVSDVDRAVADLQQQHRNRLRVGSVPMGSAFRAELLDAFAKHFPEAAIEVDEHSHPDILEGLASGRIDIGLDYNRSEQRFETIQLAELEMGLLIPVSSPLAVLDSIAVEQLASESVAMFRRDLDPVFHDKIAARLRDVGARLAICPEWTVDGVANFARHRRIATLAVPDLGAPTWPPDGLVFKTIDGLALPWRFYAVRAKGEIRPIVQRFWKFVKRFSGTL